MVLIEDSREIVVDVIEFLFEEDDFFAEKKTIVRGDPLGSLRYGSDVLSNEKLNEQVPDERVLYLLSHSLNEMKMIALEMIDFLLQKLTFTFQLLIMQR